MPPFKGGEMRRIFNAICGDLNISQHSSFSVLMNKKIQTCTLISPLLQIQPQKLALYEGSLNNSVSHVTPLTYSSTHSSNKLPAMNTCYKMG